MSTLQTETDRAPSTMHMYSLTTCTYAPISFGEVRYP